MKPNKTPHKELEALKKAFKNGAEIQGKHRKTGEWYDTVKPNWFIEREWRIKK